MLYRDILSQALKITWKNKYLWFFGLFAAILGNGGEYEILSRNIGNSSAGGTLAWFKGIKQTGIFSWQAVDNIINLAKTDTISLIMVFVVGLILVALSAFVVWLSIVSQVALVSGAANQISDGKGGDIKSGLMFGIKKFWPVFSLNLMAKVIIFAIFVILGLPVIYFASSYGTILANLFYVLMFIVFALIVLALSFIVKYAIGYAVIKGDRTWEALKAGWNLFVKNWIVSLEMAILLFLISLVVSLLYLLAVLIFAIPFILLIYIFFKLNIAIAAFITFLAIVFYVVSLGLIGATLSTFLVSSWTGLFLELVNKGGESKLVRVVNGLLEKR